MSAPKRISCSMIPEGPTRFQLGRHLIDLEAHTTGEEDLSEQECAILHSLVSRDQSVTSKADLYREVWGYRSMPRGRALDFAIRRLREKIELDPANPAFLITERGRGYRLCWTPTIASTAQKNAFRMPLPLTPWLGSTDRVDALRDALKHTRLLTLHGPAGVGKSRLILEAAAGLAGVRFVRVSAEADADSFFTSLSTALGASEIPLRADLGTMCAALVAALNGVDTQRLLIIDGAQAYTELCRTLTPMLLAHTQISIVLTTRVRLSIPEETMYSVAPLSTADAETFILARAAAAGQTLAPSAEIAELTQALDRLPLALELAAPWLRTLTPQELIERIKDDNNLLSDPVSGVSLPRLVKEAIDHIPKNQRTALDVIARFSHGLPIDIAEQLLSGLGKPLSLINALLDHSLIYKTKSPIGTSRFRATSTVSRVLKDWGPEPEEEAAIRCTLASFALEWARPSASERIHMPGYAQLRRTLRGEQDNARPWFLVLCQEGFESDAVELALSFAHLMAWTGHKRAALNLLLFCRTQTHDSRSICRYLSLAAELGAKMQDEATVDRLLREIDEHAKGDPWSMYRGALAKLTVAIARGQLSQAKRLLAEGSTLKTTDPWLQVRQAQQQHKMLAMLGELDAASTVLDPMLAFANAADDNLGRIAHHIAVAYHAFSEGAADEAMTAYRRAIPLAAHLDHQELEAGLYRRLSLAQQADGEEEAARRSRLRALSMTDPDNHPDAQAQLLATEAEYLHAHENPIAAATMARQAVDLSRLGSQHNTTLTCLRLAVVTGLDHPHGYPFFDLVEELETRSVSREAEANNLGTVSFVRGMLAIEAGKPDKALSHAKRGYATAGSAMGQLDAIYLIGQLATVAALAGHGILAQTWIEAVRAAYTGESWSTVIAEDPWFVRAREAIKDNT